MSVPGEFTAGDVLAASEMNALPGGVLGYAEVTANQTVADTETDLTGLSVTVTVPASRRIRITGQGRCRKITNAGQIIGRINESTTELNRWVDDDAQTISSENDVLGHGAAIITPSSGSHTYKLTLQGDNDGVTLIATAGTPAYILVEDIGPA